MSDLEISPHFDPDLPPLEMEDEDMGFDLLEHVMPGDHVYFGVGSALDDIQDIGAISNQDIIDVLSKMVVLGELAEKPGKADSMISQLKTRNYLISGKRSTIIELNLVGLSVKAKNYLESAAFQEQDIAIMITEVDKDSMNIDVDAGYRCLLLDAMRWTYEWSAEADGLWSCVISTSLNGFTQNNIFPFTAASWALEGE